MSQEHIVAKQIDEWGRVLIDPSVLVDVIYNGIALETLNVLPNEKVNEYNSWCNVFNKREYIIPPISTPSNTPEEEHAIRVRQWFITQEYINLDVRAALLDRCITDAERDRINMEMDMYEERDLVSLLQLMFALIDYFRNENIVWGVGRGSSCSSYCLFLIGVHKINALRYNLDIREFLK